MHSSTGWDGMSTKGSIDVVQINSVEVWNGFALDSAGHVWGM